MPQHMATATQNEAKAPACLLLLCGLPAVGKTTLARALAQHAQQQGYRCGVRVLHVCFDDFQQAGGRFHPESWKVRYRRIAWRCTLAIILRHVGMMHL